MSFQVQTLLLSGSDPNILFPSRQTLRTVDGSVNRPFRPQSRLSTSPRSDSFSHGVSFLTY